MAAVGAVRRPEWSSANSSGAASGTDELLLDTSAQCRPYSLMSGGNQASTLMADDATLSGSLLLNTGCFLPPAMTDEAFLAGLNAANSGSLYPVDSE